MPLRVFKCEVCGCRFSTFLKRPKHCKTYAIEIFKAPQVKFLEPLNPEEKERGRSKLKDFNKIAKERARNHSRDVDLHDTIQTQNNLELAKENKWINKDGQKRKKIEDI